jgi:hypothetical protein
MFASKLLLSNVTLAATVAVMFAVAGNGALAQDQVQSQTQDQMRDQDRLQDPIYGSQLMTNAERNEYRMQMRNLKTVKEREAHRLEHHKRMQERAREQGLTLPDTPPTTGKGLGAGSGGGGMGAGGGPGAGSPGRK